MEKPDAMSIQKPQWERLSTNSFLTVDDCKETSLRRDILTG